jgi:hypothetical protein
MDDLPADDQLRLAVENLHAGIMGCRVIVESLPGVESEKGDGSNRLLRKGTAEG